MIPTETKTSNLRRYITCALVGFVVGAAFIVGYRYGGRGVRVEAIRTGHASYKVVDEYGTTKFEWLPDPTMKGKAP